MIKNALKLLIIFCLLVAPVFTILAEEKIYTLVRLENEGWRISEPKTVDDVEIESLNKMKKAKEWRHDLPLVPFGFQNKAWLGFKKLINDGEMLYLISAPEKWWKQLRGTSGYAIIRNGKVVHYFRTRVN